jgi:hypothetical protein
VRWPPSQRERQRGKNEDQIKQTKKWAKKRRQKKKAKKGRQKKEGKKKKEKKH